ncbi:hypothetical protein [Bradyrhizobium genosp. P]|uniref:hypothetical protein n=1 Tax=Bradyrhizobium genosp. P TaxID=83641 RepID=UPI003CF6B979
MTAIGNYSLCFGFAIMVASRLLVARVIIIGDKLYLIGLAVCAAAIGAGISRWVTNQSPVDRMSAHLTQKARIVGTLLFVLFVLYENMYEALNHGYNHRNPYSHRNRITGAICAVFESCWLSDEKPEYREDQKAGRV